MVDPLLYSNLAERLRALRDCIGSEKKDAADVEIGSGVDETTGKPELDFQPPRETRPLDVGSETGNNSGSVQVVQLPDTQIQGIGKVIGQAVGRPGENRGLTNWRVTELTQTILGWKILCPPDARRRLLTVMTLGGAFVYLSPTPLPGLGGGIVMRADLGMQLIEDTRWGNLPQIQWYVEDQGAAIYWLLEEYYL